MQACKDYVDVGHLQRKIGLEDVLAREGPGAELRIEGHPEHVDVFRVVEEGTERADRQCFPILARDGGGKRPTRGAGTVAAAAGEQSTGGFQAEVVERDSGNEIADTADDAVDQLEITDAGQATQCGVAQTGAIRGEGAQIGQAAVVVQGIEADFGSAVEVRCVVGDATAELPLVIRLAHAFVDRYVQR